MSDVQSVGRGPRVETEFGLYFGEAGFLLVVRRVITGQDPTLTLAVGQTDDNLALKSMIFVAGLFKAVSSAGVSVIITDEEDSVGRIVLLVFFHQEKGLAGSLRIRLGWVAVEGAVGTDVRFLGQLPDIFPKQEGALSQSGLFLSSAG